MNFSNRLISITGRGAEDFEKALSFFFPGENDVVKMFAVDPKKGMILFWSRPEGERQTTGGAPIQRLPYDMKFRAALAFAWNWLETEEANALRGCEPDHDGDNEPGWNVYNESWTHVDDFWEALVGIKPIWAMYGK